ncbi:hypothetical protein ACWDPF_33545 [Streptomyces albogriseolus]
MSWSEQRRLDRAADREQDREDKRLAIEARLEAERLRAEEKRKDAAEQRRLAQLDRKARQQEQERRKAARAQSITRLRTTLAARWVDVFVGTVMALALVPAFISQAAFLRAAGLSLVMAAMAAAAIETATWAFTAMAAKAEKEHRPTARLRVGTWACALFAGALNLAHWTETNGPVVGIFFGLLTPLATLLWDWRTHTSPRDKEQRADARARAKHDRRRRSHHKDVVKLAERLVTAAPFGSLPFEDAFTAAWEIFYGTSVPGMTPALYAQQLDSRRSLGAAMDEANGGPISTRALLIERLNHAPSALFHGPEKPQVASQIPPASERASEGAQKAAKKGPKTKPVPPRRTKGDSVPFHPIAKVAAADTARRVTTVNGAH